MKFFGKTLGLLVASLTMASCGGGGGNGGTFSPPQNGTITLSADRTALPVNLGGALPSIGSPYMATVSVAFRSANGTLEAPEGEATFTIDQPNIATLSEPDDPSTTNINEFTLRLVSFHQLLNNGSGVVFVNTLVSAGTATLTVSVVDPQTHVTVSKTLTFNVTTGVGTAPATVQLQPTPAGVYFPSSGGVSASSIAATVLDGGGQFVADPVVGNSGADNIKFEIVGTAGDSRLSTNSVSGPVSGTTVTSHTVHGVATASFQVGGDATPSGPIQIRATVDRADNNVSNGIQDPLSVTTSIIVSDGKLYSLQLTSSLAAPNLPGITINCITDPCNAVSGAASGAAGTIPSNPDATLSLAITAKAQDRQGNPVIPGTPIRFGSVDEPVGAPGSAQDNQFLLSGGDGNPAEGGSTFTAPTGHFTTAGGGAGPGDALLVFGKAVQGNADLESAVTVQSVNSPTNLTVTPTFNRNDTTGVSVDYGSVLPYLIGRSLHGSITNAAATDADLAPGSVPTGVAHASLTYTVSTVGNSVAIWAQGDGIDRFTDGPRRVTDVGTLVYPGVAPLSIIASPDPIPGDTTTTVTVCVTDALGIRLRGITLGFNFTLTSGSGTVDGVPGSGAVGHPTGIDGCVQAAVTTAGLPLTGTGTGANSGTLTFNAGGQSATIHLVVQLAFLSAAPPRVCATPTPGSSVTVTAYGTGGTAVAGVALTATCSAGLTVDASATTGASGSALFHVIGTPATTGQCTFTATGAGSQSVTVTVGPGTVSPLGCAAGP